jgi:hypothetical protein
VAFPDVPGEDAFAIAFGRGLRERTGARDGAFADVEPVTGQVPPGNVGHGASFVGGGRFFDDPCLG